MAFAIAGVIGGVGFVDQEACGGEGAGKRGERIAQEAPEDGDEVEAVGVLRGPGEGFGGGFAADGERQIGFGGAVAGDRESFVGKVGEGDLPVAVGEPEGMTAGAAGEVESAAGRQGRAGFDEEGIGRGGLRFAVKEFCVPAVAVSDGIRSHVSGVIILM